MFSLIVEMILNIVTLSMECTSLPIPPPIHDTKSIMGMIVTQSVLFL